MRAMRGAVPVDGPICVVGRERALLIALAVGAQGTSALYGAWALAPWVCVSWEPRSEGGAPSIGGWVYNDSTLRVTNVRLRVEGLDDAHGTVAETFTWAQGDIIPRGRTYFVAPTLPGAATDRISIVSFDAVSLGH